jgi:hypothetical protein
MPDRAEGFKGGVHFLTGCLAATMGLYNAGEALSDRRKPRHLVNATIYGLAVIWEAINTRHHWSRRDVS